MRNLLFSAALGLLGGCFGDKDDTGTEPVGFEGDEAGECSDGADNDQDGDFDCNDDGCLESPDCIEDTAPPELNSPPSAPGVTIAPASPTTEDDLTCTIVVESDDPDGDTIEYTYSWVVDGGEVYSGTSDHYTQDRTVKGQVIQCLVQASDGWAASDVGASDAVTVVNTAPTITDIAITPADPLSTDTLTCTWEGYDDADDDDDLTLLEWTVEGAVLGESPTLTGAFTRGDVVTCTAIAYDGEDEGTELSASVTVANSAPTLSAAYLTPSDADVASTLTCTPGSVYDADGDTTIGYTYAWAIKGKLLADTTNTLAAGSFAEDDELSCGITPSDGYDDGETVWSEGVFILSGPEASLSTSRWDYGSIEAGCTETLEVTLANSGTRELIVSGTSWSGDSVFDHDLVAPTTLAVGDSETFTVSYTPTEETSYVGTLTIASNAPAGDVTIGLVGDATWASVEETHTAEITPAEVDIMFAVDKSGSMSTYITNMVDHLDTFAQRLTDNAADYRVSATVADDGCIIGSELWIDDSFTATEAAETLEEMIDLSGSYASNTERAFTLFEAALDETITGGCNEGLLRSGAELHLVGVSDEPEQSTNSWSYYYKAFAAYVDSSDLLVFHGIGGDYPSGCGSSTAYTGIYEATVASGGSFHSICTTDWDTTYEDLADAIAEPWPFETELEGVPYDEKVIVVTVEGVDAAGYWSWDPVTNVLSLESGSYEDGDEIVITYEGQASGC